MGAYLIVQTDDMELVRSVCQLPEVLESGEDGITGYEVDDRDGWLMALDGDQFIGLFNVRPLNSVCLQIHPIILKAFRGEKGFTAGREAIQWIFNNTEYRKVTGQTPFPYRHAKLFALRCGMREEGVNRYSFLKNGKLHHQWHLGVTKEEACRT